MRIIICLFLLLLLAACGSDAAYEETFDEAGAWRVGDDLDAAGEVSRGVYRFQVNSDDGQYWTTAGQRFSDGVYTVEATQTAGALDYGGFGLMFRVNDESDSFYLFEISGDGFARVSRCIGGCANEQRLNFIEDWWFESPAIITGLGETNVLQVDAEGGNFIFRVNDQEIGRISDPLLTEGDIGLYVETLGVGGVEVEFDNFTVVPIE